MPFALLGARIFDGDRMLDGHAIVIDGGRIVGLPAAEDLGAGLATQRVEGLLAPGFIDTQVNGGGGVLFNDERSAAGIRGDRRGASRLRHDRLPADLHHRHA